MSCTLTEYRRPHPRYGLADAGWYPKTGWELVDGRWQRWWRVHAGPKRMRLRRALVRNEGGCWTWSVAERDARGRWTEIARDGHNGAFPYASAQAAWPFADLAARTETTVRRSAQRRTA